MYQKIWTYIYIYIYIYLYIYLSHLKIWFRSYVKLNFNLISSHRSVLMFPVSLSSLLFFIHHLCLSLSLSASERSSWSQLFFSLFPTLPFVFLSPSCSVHANVSRTEFFWFSYALRYLKNMTLYHPVYFAPSAPYPEFFVLAARY